MSPRSLDYGESHYIGPIKVVVNPTIAMECTHHDYLNFYQGAQPNSQAWVDGYDHQAWLHLNSYFARAFKDGQYPTIIKDQIFMWARPHPKSAQAPEAVPRPTNWELVRNLSSLTKANNALFFAA